MRGSGANSWYGRANSAVLRGFSSPKHRIPDCRRNSALNAQPSECELAFADAMHHFDASNRDRRIPELLEAKHRTDALLHAAVVLLDQIVQVLRRAQLRVRGQ